MIDKCLPPLRYRTWLIKYFILRGEMCERTRRTLKRVKKK